MLDRPRIVVTLAVAAERSDPALTERKNQLYLDAITRYGGEPVRLDARSTPDERRAAFAAMDGLLLSGGEDLDPARYGRPNEGSTDIERDRDELEAEAWAAAESNDRPVLGICRGIQSINVFAGGTLLQDVGGHRGPGWRTGPAHVHPIRLLPGSRLTRILFPTNAGGGSLTVNTYHHQAVRRSDLAPGLVPAAVAPSPAGEIVEALEGSGPRFVAGVQCHPERTESTPPAFERLWRFFVEASRGSVRDDRRRRSAAGTAGSGPRAER